MPNHPPKLKPHDDKDWFVLIVVGFCIFVFILLWQLAYNGKNCWGATCYPGGSVNLHDPANQNPSYNPNTVPPSSVETPRP